ncbi:copper chaperone PCu(A)C [Halomonas sp. LS-001]
MPMLRLATLTLSTFILSTLLFAVSANADTLSIDDPYVREVPPGSPATAAFMTLHNSSDTPVSLVAAGNSITEHTEMHNHVEADGVMQMRQIETIEIPAGGETTLAPGGLHLMLIGLESPIRKGDNVSLNLTFDNGETLEFSAPVRPVMPMKH